MKSVPIELIKGIEYDLKEQVNVKTFEQLIKYCYQGCRNSWFYVL